MWVPVIQPPNQGAISVEPVDFTVEVQSTVAPAKYDFITLDLGNISTLVENYEFGDEASGWYIARVADTVAEENTPIGGVIISDPPDGGATFTNGQKATVRLYGITDANVYSTDVAGFEAGRDLILDGVTALAQGKLVEGGNSLEKRVGLLLEAHDGGDDEQTLKVFVNGWTGW